MMENRQVPLRVFGRDIESFTTDLLQHLVSLFDWDAEDDDYLPYPSDHSRENLSNA